MPSRSGNTRSTCYVETHMKPTSEQQAIIDAAVKGDQLVVQAGAGTGKTSTLVLVANAIAPKNTLYVVYNKAAQVDGAGRMPGHVTVKTAHSLAFGTVGKKYSKRLNGGRIPARVVASILGTSNLRLSNEVQLPANHVARIAMETVRNFTHSADATIEFRHVPHVNNVDGNLHSKMVNVVLGFARKAWKDIEQVNGRLPFSHDDYLKIWALGNPKLKFEVVMLDEAQDTNPVLAKVIRDQADHAQLIVVGDGCQQMYAWRGATDALAQFPDATELFLTQSWRFGQVIADEANKWLALLDTKLRLSGNLSLDSQLTDILDGEADAVLCRTNAGAMVSVMALLKTGQKVALVGGGTAIQKLAEAAVDLQSGRKTWHPDLFAFSSWEEVSQYARNESEGRDLLPFVKLIEEHGTESIIAATSKLVSEDKADVVVSTAHKAKGREWDRVRIGSDYQVPTEDKPLTPAEVMVSYVAVTRAKLALDRGSLAWVDGQE